LAANSLADRDRLARAPGAGDRDRKSLGSVLKILRREGHAMSTSKFIADGMLSDANRTGPTAQREG
jgi:hypothetical protein